MPSPTTYSLVSLPLRLFDTGDKEEAISSLKAKISSENGTVWPFNVPDFKIGTLDTLVQQADELTKLSHTCEGVVAKIGDSLRSILDGDDDKLEQQKLVNDKPMEQYLRTFSWNRVRYRADRPLSELVENLHKEITNTDNDIKAKFNQYNGIKTNLASLERKQTGNLATKSLTPIVKPDLLIQSSEYIETHLIAVPVNSRKDFLRSYESIAPMVVPRSAVQVAQDDEFVLFTVTTFKKYSGDFLAKCREQKWTPRQYKYVEGGKEEEQRELEKTTREEKKVWGEALRLGRTGWSESIMVWTHVLTLRVFVETVLRYGLPLEFVCALIKTTPKQLKKVKTALDSQFSSLGGNAVSRDKRGRVTKDDAAMASELTAAGLGSGDGNEYTAYVYYEFEFP